MSQFVTFKLLQPVTHGFFTVGQSYPCVRKTALGNGGQRGFYWDNRGMVRMLRADCFATEPDGVWQPPEPARYLENRHREAMAERWGVVKQSVYQWQRGSVPLRWYDLVRGSELPQRDDPITDLREFAQQYGIYVQELAARWKMQQFGQYLKNHAAGENPAYFWDLWRGMMLNAGETIDEI